MSKRKTTKTVKETTEVQTMAAEMPEEAMPAAASEAEVQTASEETPIALAAEATAETSSALPVDKLDEVQLGRQGEALVTLVQIDASAWLEQLPGCTLLVAALRPTESVVYLPNVTVQGGLISWRVTKDDTAKAGWGRAEVRGLVDGKVKKSAVFRTCIEPSLEGNGTPAEPTPPSWVQTIMDAVQKAQDAAQKAADAASTAATAANTAQTAATQAATNTAGLLGWGLTQEEDGTVTLTRQEVQSNE